MLGHEATCRGFLNRDNQGTLAAYRVHTTPYWGPWYLAERPKKPWNWQGGRHVSGGNQACEYDGDEGGLPDRETGGMPSSSEGQK
jgi:hypothetical protein